MAKIKTIDDLRERVLDAFEDLSKQRITHEEANALAKLNDTIVAGLKTQMEYAKLTEKIPYIPFLSDCVANGESRKLLLADSNDANNDKDNDE